MDSSYPLVPFLNLLFSLLVLLPLPWQLRSWNSGICMVIIWTSTNCLIVGVNAVVWRDNVEDSARVWCEITTRLTIAATVGIPACTFIITRRLYLASRLRSLVTTKSEKYIQVFVDMTFCLGVPCLVVGIYYIFQPYRYMIAEEIGCNPVIYPTALSIVLLRSWSIILGLMSACYCPFIIMSLTRQYQGLGEFLNSCSSLSKHRYTYLTAFACISAFSPVSYNISTLCVDLVASPVLPWPGFTAVHKAYDTVPTQTAEEWRSESLNAGTLGVDLRFSIWNQWASVFAAFVTFVFFGLGTETRARYVEAFWRVVGVVGVKRRLAKPRPDVTVSLAFASGAGPDAQQRDTGTTSTVSDDARAWDVHGAATGPAFPVRCNVMLKEATEDDSESWEPKRTETEPEIDSGAKIPSIWTYNLQTTLSRSVEKVFPPITSCRFDSSIQTLAGDSDDQSW